ncbi:hypothetical protein NG726_24600 [Pseudomonas sp. MOB-449]|nr:hypothetical protein [Pseudomonas sp. MOB-449]
MAGANNFLDDLVGCGFVKTKLMSLQFAFFFKDIVARPDVEFNSLNADMLNIFDAIPQMMPVPKELPIDIPIVVLSSERGDYSCNISRTRLDFHLQRDGGERTNSEILKDFNAKVSGLVRYVVAKQEIARFGMVARYFHQDNFPVRVLQKKFFTAAMDGVEELAVRYNRKSSSFGFEVNDVVEVSVVEATTDGKKEKGVFVQRDINSSPASARLLDVETLYKISQKFAPRLGEAEIEGLIK